MYNIFRNWICGAGNMPIAPVAIETLPLPPAAAEVLPCPPAKASIDWASYLVDEGDLTDADLDAAVIDNPEEIDFSDVIDGVWDGAHRAARDGHNEDLFAILTSQDECEWNNPDRMGFLPLTYAIRNGRLATVELLLEYFKVNERLCGVNFEAAMNTTAFFHNCEDSKAAKANYADIFAMLKSYRDLGNDSTNHEEVDLTAIEEEVLAAIPITPFKETAARTRLSSELQRAETASSDH